MDIKQDPRNARRHNQRNKDAVRKSLEELKVGRPVVADNEGFLIAGNLTFEQAKSLGLDVEVVHSTGDKLLVVVRDDLSPDDPRRKALAVADNKTNDLSEFSADALKEVLTGVSDEILEATGFDDDEIDALFKTGSGPEGGTGGDDGGTTPAPATPITEKGRIYQLGKHRLMCGSGAEADDLKRLLSGEKANLVVAAPPYDFSVYDGFLSSLSDVLDGAFYIFYKPGMELEFFGFWSQNLELISSLVWVKPEPEAAGSGYRCCHEPFVYGVSVGTSPRVKKLTDEWSVWTIEESDDRLPVAIIEKILRNHDKGIVLDPFASGGATLVACETTRRVCRLMESDPLLCDAIVRRYCVMKGCDAEDVFASGVAEPSQ